MKAELPIEMPDATKILEAANLSEAPCAMVRLDAPCCNTADKGLMYPSVDGLYITVYICNMCLDGTP